jgi:hypothetical protein
MGTRPRERENPWKAYAEVPEGTYRNFLDKKRVYQWNSFSK